MPLEPALQQFVDTVAAQPLPDDLRVLRALSEDALPRLQGTPQPVAHVVEHVLMARDGQPLVLRLYTPAGLSGGGGPSCVTPSCREGGGW